MVCIFFFSDEEQSEIEELVCIPENADAVERVDGVVGGGCVVGYVYCCGGQGGEAEEGEEGGFHGELGEGGWLVVQMDRVEVEEV